MRYRYLFACLAVFSCAILALGTSVAFATVTFDSIGTMTLATASGYTNSLTLSLSASIASGSGSTNATGYYSLELVGTADTSTGAINITGLQYVAQSGTGDISCSDFSVAMKFLTVTVETVSFTGLKGDLYTSGGTVAKSGNTYPLTTSNLLLNGGTATATGNTPATQDFGASPVSGVLSGSGTITLSNTSVSANLASFTATVLTPILSSSVIDGANCQTSGTIRAVGNYSTRLAATYTWTGSSSNAWNTVGNWNLGNFTPGSTDSILLANGGTIDLGGGTQSVVNVGTSGNGVVGNITDGTLAFTGDMYVASGTISSNIANNGSGQLWLGGGANTYLVNTNTSVATTCTGSVTLNSTPYIGGDGNMTISGAISGNYGFTKIGAGILTLTGTNTYSGPTTVNGGVLQITSDAQLGTAPTSPATNIIFNGGELKNNGSMVTLAATRNVYLGASGGYIQPGWGPTGGFTVNGQISGPGGLGVVWDAGVVILNGSNSYQGATTIGAYGNYYWDTTAANPTLQLGNNNALPGTDLIFGTSANSNTATLDMHGFNATVGALSGSSNAIVDILSGGGASVLTVGNNNASSTFSGVIQNTSGTLSLIKVGAGVLTLLGANTYAGGTTINGGTLQILGDAQLGAAPTSAATNITFNGGEMYNYGSRVTLAATRNVYLGAGGGYFQPGWGSTGGFAVNGQISGPGGLGVAWDGGVLILNGSNTYQGATTIGAYANLYWNDPSANPILQLGNNNALPGTDLIFGSDANNNTATLDMNGFSATVGALSGGTNSIVDIVSSGGASTLTVGNNNASSTFGGVIRNTTGSLSLVKIGTGTLTLSGSTTSVAALTINAGNLAINAGTSFTNGGIAYIGYAASSSGALTLNSGVFNNNSNWMYVGYTTGSTGTLNINGGTLSNTTGKCEIGFNGTGIYNQTAGYVNVYQFIVGGNAYGAGTATISGGTLNTQNDCKAGWNYNGITVPPGATGILNVQGNAVVTCAVDFGIGGDQRFDTGIMNLSGNASINIGSSTFYIGRGNAGAPDHTSGSMSQTGGTFTGSNTLNMGNESCTATLNVSGGLFQLTNTGADIQNFSAGASGSDTYGSLGSVQNIYLSGAGVMQLSGAMYLGNQSYTTASFNQSGGSLSVGAVYVDTAANTSASFSVSAGTATIASMVVGNSTGTATVVQSGGVVNMGGSISGSGTYSLSSGKLAMNANNISGVALGFSGGTITDAATVSSNITLASGTGAVFQQSGTATTTVSGAIYGNGQLIQAGLGTLDLTGSAMLNYSGTTTIASGTLKAAYASLARWRAPPSTCNRARARF